MTREEYMRLMAMRAEQQRFEYNELRKAQELKRLYDLQIARDAARLDHLRQMEAAKIKKSAIALEAEKGNVIDAEFVEVKPEKSPSKLIPKGS